MSLPDRSLPDRRHPENEDFLMKGDDGSPPPDVVPDTAEEEEEDFPDDLVDPVTYEPLSSAVTLFPCGHVFNESTVQTASKCHICRALKQASSPAWTIRKLVDEAVSKRVGRSPQMPGPLKKKILLEPSLLCSTHDLPQDFFCENDGSFVCSMCFVKGERHHKHDVVTAASLIPELKRQLNSYADSLSNVKTMCHHGQRLLLSNTEQASTKLEQACRVVAQPFDRLRHVLDHRQEKMVAKLKIETQRIVDDYRTQSRSLALQEQRADSLLSTIRPLASSPQPSLQQVKIMKNSELTQSVRQMLASPVVIEKDVLPLPTLNCSEGAELLIESMLDLLVTFSADRMPNVEKGSEYGSTLLLMKRTLKVYAEEVCKVIAARNETKTFDACLMNATALLFPSQLVPFDPAKGLGKRLRRYLFSSVIASCIFLEYDIFPFKYAPESLTSDSSVRADLIASYGERAHRILNAGNPLPFSDLYLEDQSFQMWFEGVVAALSRMFKPVFSSEASFGENGWEKTMLTDNIRTLAKAFWGLCWQSISLPLRPQLISRVFPGTDHDSSLFDPVNDLDESENELFQGHKRVMFMYFPGIFSSPSTLIRPSVFLEFISPSGSLEDLESQRSLDRQVSANDETVTSSASLPVPSKGGLPHSSSALGIPPKSKLQYVSDSAHLVPDSSKHSHVSAHRIRPVPPTLANPRFPSTSSSPYSSSSLHPGLPVSPSSSFSPPLFVPTLPSAPSNDEPVTQNPVLPEALLNEILPIPWSTLPQCTLEGSAENKLLVETLLRQYQMILRKFAKSLVQDQSLIPEEWARRVDAATAIADQIVKTDLQNLTSLSFIFQDEWQEIQPHLLDLTLADLKKDPRFVQWSENVRTEVIAQLSFYRHFPTASFELLFLALFEIWKMRWLCVSFSRNSRFLLQILGQGDLLAIAFEEVDDHTV